MLFDVIVVDCRCRGHLCRFHHAILHSKSLVDSHLVVVGGYLGHVWLHSHTSHSQSRMATEEVSQTPPASEEEETTGLYNEEDALAVEEDSIPHIPLLADYCIAIGVFAVNAFLVVGLASLYLWDHARREYDRYIHVKAVGRYDSCFNSFSYLPYGILRLVVLVATFAVDAILFFRAARYYKKQFEEHRRATSAVEDDDDEHEETKATILVRLSKTVDES